jgi:CO/xanthine dehydrogenase FAD-binding subunit
MIAFDYIRPSTEKAALDAISKNGSAQFIAGGTNIIDLMKKGVTAPQKLIDINDLPLKEINEVNDELHIGALAIFCSVQDALIFMISRCHAINEMLVAAVVHYRDITECMPYLAPVIHA